MYKSYKYLSWQNFCILVTKSCFSIFSHASNTAITGRKFCEISMTSHVIPGIFHILRLFYANLQAPCVLSLGLSSNFFTLSFLFFPFTRGGVLSNATFFRNCLIINFFKKWISAQNHFYNLLVFLLISWVHTFILFIMSWVLIFQVAWDPGRKWFLR